MRYYLINDRSELVVELVRTTKINNDQYTFEFRHLDKDKVVHEQKFFIRKLASKYYLSENGIAWEKMPKMRMPSFITHVDQVYKLFRGYKPSGAFANDSGALVTQMPGKIVKVLVKEGDLVEKGQKVLILEAMKMENEIKTASSGKVKKIYALPGATVDAGFLLMELDSNE